MLTRKKNCVSIREVADLAQLVEQRIRNAQVVSSSLTVGSIKKITAPKVFRGFFDKYFLKGGVIL